MKYYIVHSRKGSNNPEDKYSVTSDTQQEARQKVYSLICSFDREENIWALGWKDKGDFLNGAVVLPEFDSAGYRINR